MNFRTDLALEAAQIHKNINGLDLKEEKMENSIITKMDIKTDEASKKIGKPKGKYVTISLPPLTDYFKYSDSRIKIIAKEINSLIPKSGLVLVAGLGNTEITPDALGPKAASKVLATRHISSEISKAIGLERFRPVSVLAPGVLGQTGIEVAEIISSLVKSIKPSCLIVVDALASRRLSRLGCTVQLSNSGIAPGAGVGNNRPLLNEKSLGIPVIGIGVPTVVDALTLARDILEDYSNFDLEKINETRESFGENMVVTPKEVDLLINRAALLISMSINCALQPDFSADELYSLVS